MGDISQDVGHWTLGREGHSGCTEYIWEELRLTLLQEDKGGCNIDSALALMTVFLFNILEWAELTIFELLLCTCDTGLCMDFKYIISIVTTLKTKCF